jgi:stalled ribosome rescue protein Dom34
MKTTAGVWIDHRKAVVVAVTDEGEEVALTISNVETQLRRSGALPLKGNRSQTMEIPADDSRQKKSTAQFNAYYDAVIASIRDADSILLFGPGEAKGELQERIEKSALRGHIVAVETVDKMTNRQIAAKAREYFR